jgi:hypothetical protein
LHVRLRWQTQRFSTTFSRHETLRGAWGELPPSNPEGSSLGADDIQIHRRDPYQGGITSGVIELAWEKVKEKPFEALFLAFLSLIFGGGGGSCNVPNPGGGSGFDDSGSDYNYEGSDYTYEFFGNFKMQSLLDSLGGADATGNLFGNIGGAELGIIAVIVVLAFVIGIVFWVIGSLVQGGQVIFWMRHIRGQNSDLGKSTRAVGFLLPIMITNLIVGLATVFGMVLLIIPGIIIALGMQFVVYIVCDKNVGYLEAMKVSWRLTDGHKVDILLLLIILFFLNIAGLLACCVGVIATTAIAQGSLAIVYDRLAEPGNAYLESGEEMSHVFE